MRPQAPRPTGQEKAAKYAAAGKMQIPDRDRLREPAQAYLARRAKKRPPLKGGRCICGAKVCRGGNRHRFRCLLLRWRRRFKPISVIPSFVVATFERRPNTVHHPALALRMLAPIGNRHPYNAFAVKVGNRLVSFLQLSPSAHTSSFPITGPTQRSKRPPQWALFVK